MVSEKNFKIIIDSHSHWGPSISMGMDVTSGELQRQQKESGVTHVVIIPFPSTAIADNGINERLLDETGKIQVFIPYHYIREDYDKDGFDPLPEAYYGGKWHWMRGRQDTASNYDVLNDKALPELIEKIRKTEKPVVVEEDLAFTERLVDMAEGIRFIIPHLGLLGGDPHMFLRSFKNNDNVYFDTALATQDNISNFVKTIGPERILFGSDVPFGSMRSELSKVLALPVSYEDKEMLLYKNFLRLTNYKLEP
jgi:predicted TIM-barrel fold metal-dependent hydrolase